jgi:hypothetical protein
MTGMLLNGTGDLKIDNGSLALGDVLLQNRQCLLMAEKGEITDSTVRHESIHAQQMWEMLVIGFYLWYLAEWLNSTHVFGLYTLRNTQINSALVYDKNNFFHVVV